MKMQNKKAKQIAAKKKHREFIKSKRRIEPKLERKVPTLTEKPTILIVCEGENTELLYFNQFRLSTATIKSVGVGYNTVSLVKKATQLSELISYDQVWCVFDKDDFSNIDFNNAISIAEASGFFVAYSNQAFEYWLILHFNDHQGGAMHRYQYCSLLNTHLNTYNITFDCDSKLVSDSLFDLLGDRDESTGRLRRDIAIDRAERNYNHLDHNSPALEESSTTVFKLVRELLKYI